MSRLLLIGPVAHQVAALERPVDARFAEQMALFVALSIRLRDAPMARSLRAKLFDAVEAVAREIDGPAFANEYTMLVQLTLDSPDAAQLLAPFLPTLARWLN